jgi:hypothetical protein
MSIGVNHFYDGFNVLNRGVRQDSMPQIEDMPRFVVCAAQNIFYAGSNVGLWSKENCRIKIALDSHVCAKQSPTFI